MILFLLKQSYSAAINVIPYLGENQGTRMFDDIVEAFNNPLVTGVCYFTGARFHILRKKLKKDLVKPVNLPINWWKKFFRFH